MNDMNQSQKVDSANDEIDLLEILKILWSGRVFICLVSISTTILLLSFSLLITQKYTSEAILIAKDGRDQGNISQISNIASIVGMDLGGSSEIPSKEMIQIIQSRDFIKHLLTFDDIMPSIMFPKSFDKDTGKLILKSRQKDVSYLKVHRRYIRQMLTIAQDKSTGFITIKIEHISPVFARNFLDLIIREANSLKRNKDILQSAEALQYLELELSKTPLVQIKESINALIEGQLEIQMMARIQDDYVLKSIEPPFIPEKPSFPPRFLISILGLILGLLTSSIIVLFKKDLQNH